MKRSALAFAASAALAVGTIGTAKAVDVGVGPGGVYVGPSYRGHYNEYRYGGHCRVVISHRINRFGERVEERRRICD
jgi:hypothetical protein